MLNINIHMTDPHIIQEGFTALMELVRSGIWPATLQEQVVVAGWYVIMVLAIGADTFFVLKSRGKRDRSKPKQKES